jgi:hypothetical protein
VKAAVHQWLRAQLKTFFSEGIKKLVWRWEKCITKQRDYIEKWCNLLLKFLINGVKKIKCGNFLKYLHTLPEYKSGYGVKWIRTELYILCFLKNRNISVAKFSNLENWSLETNKGVKNSSYCMQDSFKAYEGEFSITLLEQKFGECLMTR